MRRRRRKSWRKSTMPLPVADEGMALFPQPQLLQGYANADLQKLNAARWICFNPRWPAAHGRSSPTTGTTSSQASYSLRRRFLLCIKSPVGLPPRGRPEAAHGPGDPAAAEEEVSAGGADRGGSLSAVSLLHHPFIPSFPVVLLLKHCFNFEAAVPLFPPDFFPIHPKTARFDRLFLSI